MLSAALATSAEGITGFWDGSATRNARQGTGAWSDFIRLQPDARLTVLRHELAPLFQVTKPGSLELALLPGAATPLLELTPPTVAELKAQLSHLRTAADLRADRMAEILIQQSDLPSFFGSQFYLHPERKKWTLVLLAAAYEAVIRPEMRLKLYSSLPRPIDFSEQVQPVIATPSHSAYPSGHATEAFNFATVLALLSLAAEGDATPVATLLARLAPGSAATAAQLMPFRLAARIADNRTVAGVHFPVDSAHGALLGLSCGLAFFGSVAETATNVPTWSALGADWTLYFTFDEWRNALAPWQAAGGGDLALPGSGAGSLLGALWAEAVNEWAADLV